MAHAYNPSTLGGRSEWITRSTDRDHPGQHGDTPSLLKIQKISWAWWHMPVIPATQEAEAGELPEPRRRRLWWAEIAPLYSSLGNKSETPSQKKNKKTKKQSFWRIAPLYVILFLWLLLKFSFYLLFQLCLCIVFFEFILIRICYTSWKCKFVSNQIWEIFKHDFFKHVCCWCYPFPPCFPSRMPIIHA